MVIISGISLKWKVCASKNYTLMTVALASHDHQVAVLTSLKLLQHWNLLQRTTNHLDSVMSVEINTVHTVSCGFYQYWQKQPQLVIEQLCQSSRGIYLSPQDTFPLQALFSNFLSCVVVFFSGHATSLSVGFYCCWGPIWGATAVTWSCGKFALCCKVKILDVN